MLMSVLCFFEVILHSSRLLRKLSRISSVLNSFDQEGVQLGKVLAKRVLAHETDGALKVYSDLLNI